MMRLQKRKMTGQPKFYPFFKSYVSQMMYVLAVPETAHVLQRKILLHVPLQYYNAFHFSFLVKNVLVDQASMKGLAHLDSACVVSVS